MWRLARRAAAWLERPDIDGLVITHGTDTIEETAFLLDLVLTSDKPVVLVGAMRTVSDPSWDGPAICSPPCASRPSPAARGRGVLVVMDEQILPAREVRKVHTEASGSFATPEFGPLGVVDAGAVMFRRAPLPRPAWRDAGAEPGLRVQRLETRVELVQAYTGMDDRARPRVPGGRRARAGGRRLRPRQRAAGDRAGARRRGRAPASSSRSRRDASPAASSPRYGYEGGGLHLAQIGAILAGDLSGAKARLLQMVGARTTADPARRARSSASDSAGFAG